MTIECSRCGGNHMRSECPTLGNSAEKQQPLNGQQMQALQRQMQDKLTGIIRDVDLRKWSIEQACGLVGAVDAVKMAREIHRFLTEGAVERA